MATRQTTIRFPERTDQQIAELVALFGDVTKTVVVAIDRLYQSEIGERKMDELMTGTDDRVAQVNWLRELAVNIASNLGEGTAEELVEFALGEDAESWGVELPEWFDEHDRALLTRFVAEQL